MKRVNGVKEDFLTQVQLESWEEAEKRLPNYAKPDKLKIFQNQNKSPSLKHEFSVCFTILILATIFVTTPVCPNRIFVAKLKPVLMMVTKIAKRTTLNI